MKKHVVLFIIDSDKILLAMKKRGFGKDKWNGVGGKVEKGESFTEAAIRECQEEVGITPIRPVPMADIIFEEFHDGKKHELDVRAFVAKKWQGKPVETEEMAPRWFSINNIPFKQMWADDPLWLPNILRGEKMKGKFVLDQNGQIIFHNIKKVDKISV